MAKVNFYQIPYVFKPIFKCNGPKLNHAILKYWYCVERCDQTENLLIVTLAEKGHEKLIKYLRYQMDFKLESTFKIQDKLRPFYFKETRRVFGLLLPNIL